MVHEVLARAIAIAFSETSLVAVFNSLTFFSAVLRCNAPLLASELRVSQATSSVPKLYFVFLQL